MFQRCWARTEVAAPNYLTTNYYHYHHYHHYHDYYHYDYYLLLLLLLVCAHLRGIGIMCILRSSRQMGSRRSQLLMTARRSSGVRNLASVCAHLRGMRSLARWAVW